MLPLLDPAVEFEVGGEAPLRGVDAVAAYMRRLPESFSALSYEVEEAREAGTAVLVLVHSSARGAVSDISTDARTAHLWRFEGDRVVHFAVYPVRAEGLAAFNAAGS